MGQHRRVVAGICQLPGKNRNRLPAETASRALTNQGLRTVTPRLWDGCEKKLGATELLVGSCETGFNG